MTDISPKIDLKLFLVIWNQRMGLTTPQVHFRIAGWLETAWENGDTRLLLMAFRSCGKSTLVGVFSAWILYRNPSLRIMVVAADHALAKKMVRNVKRIIERHPLTAHMKPDKPDSWAGDSFIVRRDVEFRDPSMMAKGVSANITGSRADVILYDDVEVPNTCDTAGKRTELRERLGEIGFVLTPGGTQLYVGTPHTYHTIYAKEARQEIGEDEEFLSQYKRLEIPILDAQGESVWPERYTKKDIEAIRRQSGPNKFNSQMMLIPVNIADGRLDASLLNIYDDDWQYSKELRTLFIGSKKMISASAWWDPAFGSATGDHSVLAVVFVDEAGDLYLHRMAYIKADKITDETDEATYQCRIIAKIAKDLMLPSICVETNGIGKFLPSILRNEMAHARAQCTVKEMTSRRAKDLRILEAFDAALAARRLYVHKSVLDTPFITEMQEWQPGVNKGHDDGLDAAAGAIAQEPVRIKRVYGTRRPHGWGVSAGTTRARSDFEV